MATVATSKLSPFLYSGSRPSAQRTARASSVRTVMMPTSVPVTSSGGVARCGDVPVMLMVAPSPTAAGPFMLMVPSRLTIPLFSMRLLMFPLRPLPVPSPQRRMLHC